MSHKNNIPTLSDICREIDNGTFEMQEDEVIVYYPSRLDVENDTPAISDLAEILFLYDRRQSMMRLLEEKGLLKDKHKDRREIVQPKPIKKKKRK